MMIVLLLKHKNRKNMNKKEDTTLGQLTPNDIQQQYPDTCAIKSQQIILQSHDIDVSEDELVRESIEKDGILLGQEPLPLKLEIYLRNMV